MAPARQNRSPWRPSGPHPTACCPTAVARTPRTGCIWPGWQRACARPWPACRSMAVLVKLEAGGWVVAIDGAGPSNGPTQGAHGVLGQARERTAATRGWTNSSACDCKWMDSLRQFP